MFHRTGDSLGKLVGIAAALSAVAVVFVVVAVARVQGFNTLDEYTHLDWVYQLLHGNIPADGDVAAPKILADWACLGQWNARLPPCGQPADPSAFPLDGQQYNAFHLPLYYLITAGLVQFGQLFVGDQHFVTLAQLTGGLWLAAGMVLLYVACRVWRIGTLYAIAAPLLLLTLPRIITSSTIVNDDAPAVVAGAYALYYLGRFRISRVVYLVVPSLLTALFAATKLLNALPMYVIAAGLGWLGLVAIVRRQHRTGWLRLRASAFLVIPPVLLYVGWNRFQSGRALPGWVNPVIGINSKELTGNPLTAWITSLPSGFNLVSGVHLDPVLQSRYLLAWNVAISLPIVAASLMCLVLYRRGNRRRWPAIVLFAGCALYPLLVQVQAYLSSAPYYFPAISTRYGISLIPLAVCCIAMVADTRGLRRTTIAVLAVGLIAASGAVFGYPPR